MSDLQVHQPNTRELSALADYHIKCGIAFVQAGAPSGAFDHASKARAVLRDLQKAIVREMGDGFSKGDGVLSSSGFRVTTPDPGEDVRRFDPSNLEAPAFLRGHHPPIRLKDFGKDRQ